MEKLYTCANIIELQEIQQNLKQDGINAEIVENINSFGDAAGTVSTYSLYVDEENVETAKLYIPKEESEGEKSLLWCPQCGSEDIKKEIIKRNRGSNWFLIVGIILISITVILSIITSFNRIYFSLIGIAFIVTYFIGYTEEKYHCESCNHRFKRY